MSVVWTFRKQLFQMVTNSSISDHDESHPGTSNIQNLTPPEQLIMPEGLFDQAVNQRQPRQPHQERNPPDHGVVTQQTEILAEMIAELRARQPAVQPVNPAEPSGDPAFDWTRLALPSETDFQVPGTGLVQRVDHWLDLRDDERIWAFQRLYLHCIVAALGWPAATAACASTTATTDFVLPPGAVLPQQKPQGQRRKQPAAAAPQAAAAAPPSQQHQRRGGNGRNNQPRGGRGGRQ